MLTLLAVLYIFVLEDCDADFSGKTCKIPNADAGTCIALNKCRPLDELNRKRPKTSEEDKFLRQSVASCVSGGVKVKACCPPPSEWHKMAFNPVVYPDEHNYNKVVSPSETAHPIGTSETVDQKYAPNRNGDDNGQPAVIATPLKIPDNNTKPNETDLLSMWYDKYTDSGLSTDTCGIDTTSSSRITGGTVLEPDQYPWLALLEYGMPGSRDWKCGGSLISKSHVLTAAHCLYIEPKRVRLSEYNLTTDPIDTVSTAGGGFEDITVVIVDVFWSIQHPQHVTMKSINDIGLIKTVKPVEFTDFIKPICLPARDYREEFSRDTILSVAGWGGDGMHTHTEVKMGLAVPYVAHGVCVDSFPGLLPEQHICAGGEKRKDTCKGDSGGPLMFEDKSTPENSYFYIVGVVSSGSVDCTIGKPGLYTDVYKYVEWIMKLMNR